MANEETKAAELLPCPFCDSKELDEVFGSLDFNYVKCKKCNARGAKVHDDADEAARLWNTRTSNRAQRLADARLGAELMMRYHIVESHPIKTEDKVQEWMERYDNEVAPEFAKTLDGEVEG